MSREDCLNGKSLHRWGPGDDLGEASLASDVKPAILLLPLLVTSALGVADSPPIEPDDDLSPMLLAFALVGLCIVLFLVGAGVVAAAVFAVSAATLVALGIVSSAVFVGILRRRFASGLRTLHYLVCAAAAIPAGLGALWIGSHFFTTPLRFRDILVIGSVAGICGGMLLAFAVDRVAGIAYRRFVTPRIPEVTGNN